MINQVMSKELATKLFNVFEKTEGLVKDLDVGGKYRAVGEASVLNMIKPLFKEQRLIVIPKDGEIEDNLFSFVDGYGKNKLRAITQLKVYFTIVDADTGEGIDIIGFGNGADSQDKGSGKAFTYAFKTSLQKTFMLFSGEDTDNTHSNDIDPEPTEAEKTANFKILIDKQKDIAEKANYDFVVDILNECGVDTLKEVYTILPIQRKETLSQIKRQIEKKGKPNE